MLLIILPYVLLLWVWAMAFEISTLSQGEGDKLLCVRSFKCNLSGWCLLQNRKKGWSYIHRIRSPISKLTPRTSSSGPPFFPHYRLFPVFGNKKATHGEAPYRWDRVFSGTSRALLERIARHLWFWNIEYDGDGWAVEKVVPAACQPKAPLSNGIAPLPRKFSFPAPGAEPTGKP